MDHPQRSLSRALLAGGALALLAGPADGARGSDPPTTSVPIIVQADPGQMAAAATAVERLGGTITQELAIVDGVAATVDREVLAELGAEPAIRAVSPDLPVHLQAEPTRTRAPRSAYRQATGGAKLAAAGIAGRGVTVALLDTGVADVADLAGRIVNVTDPLTGSARCVDFSGEGHCRDSYGHGTFMAGIIAGNGAASDGRWRGMAPAAKVLSLKVAGHDGSSDVSKVLAAIQWAVSFREEYGIQVLNLSLGTDSTQSWKIDPFNYAVERAWRAGIFVTVAASNRGPSPRTISKPGDDPWVLTVGAIDDRGTAALRDDRLPDFSSRGPTPDGVGKPDLVAPGAHLVSLRAPGSAIDGLFPNYVDGSYRLGSGTSMATAAVSGGVALMLERNPAFTPDQVKGALLATARPAASRDRSAVGAGAVDFAAAAGSTGDGLAPPASQSSGMGSLSASRGSVRVATSSPLGTVVNAIPTVQVLAWDPIGFTTGDWTTETWPKSAWARVGQRWYATKWYGDDWQGGGWQGNNWHGNNWHGDWEGSTKGDERMTSDSYGRPWKGAAWYGLWE